MRSLVRHGLVVGSCLLAMVVSSGCQAKKATEYVNGISTQMSVPRDIKAIRLQISTQGGSVQFCNSYTAYNGIVQLPRSLGNYPASDDALKTGALRFEIVGLTEDYSKDSANPIFNFCEGEAKVGSDNVRIMRSSTQPYIPERIIFLPMGLNYSCYDTPCDKGKTCKGGTCVDEVMSAEDAAKLPDYVDGMGDGNDGACFSVGTCMGAALPAIPINYDTCDFALPETKDAPTPVAGDPFRPACNADSDCNGGTVPADATKVRKCTNNLCDLLPQGSPAWTGLNVQVAYDGGHTNQILDLDPVEGFTIPDPTKPQNFRLAPGLCAMLHGTDGTNPTKHLISGVRASGICGPKTVSQSICHADQLALMGTDPNGKGTDAGDCQIAALEPSRAALAIVIDDTQNNQSFFNASDIAKFQSPLGDPSFARTDFSLLLAPPLGNVAGACDASRAPDINFENQKSAEADFKTKFDAVIAQGSFPNGDPSLAGSLAAAYKALAALPPGQYLRRAVLVVSAGNAWNSDSCSAQSLGTPAAQAQAAQSGPNNILTYPLQLTGTPDAATAQGSGLSALAAAGSPQSGPSVALSDIWPSNSEKAAAFSKIVDRLATCAYDVDQDKRPGNDAVMSYNDPLTNTRSAPIKFNAACNSDSATRDPSVSGWGFDPAPPTGKARLYVCGADCSTYQGVLRNAEAFSLDYSQTPIASPMYLRSAGCADK